MQPHPRIRKTIKWGGAMVTVLLAAVWIGSAWSVFVWHSPRTGVAVIRGGLRFETFAAPQPKSLISPGARFWALSPEQQLKWFWRYPPSAGHATRTYVVVLTLSSPSEFWLIEFKLWPIVALSAASTFIAWRLDTLARRRAQLNLCRKCHYDRTGLAREAKCPECGTDPVGKESDSSPS